MALEVGIVGLPNSGKTTLFNALTRAGAEITAYASVSEKPNVGMATIADTKHIDNEVKLNKVTRDFTKKFFVDAGYKVSDSHGNFLMVAINRDIRGFKDACAKQGVLVGRPFPPLLTHARISIGTMAEMEKATAVFKQVLSSSAD